VAAEDVQVGDQRLGGGVLGRGGRGCPRRGGVDAVGAQQQLDLGQARAGEVVGGVLGQRLLVRRGCRRQVVALDRVERLLVQRGQRRLDVVDRLGRRRVPGEHPGDPVRAGHLEQLVQERAHLLLGHRALEQRHRLTLDDRDDHRDRLGLEHLAEAGVGVDVDLGQQEPPPVLDGEPLEHRAERLAGLAPLGPQVDDHGHGHGLLDDDALERGLVDVDDERPGSGGRGWRLLAAFGGGSDGGEVDCAAHRDGGTGGLAHGSILSDAGQRALIRSGSSENAISRTGPPPVRGTARTTTCTVVTCADLVILRSPPARAR